METGNQISNCPVEIVMMFLKDRLGILIIGHLQQKPMTFGQLQENIAGIQAEIMQKRIEEMEKQGILMQGEKYCLTPFGRSFQDILLEMEKWGEIQKNRQ